MNDYYLIEISFPTFLEPQVFFLLCWRHCGYINFWLCGKQSTSYKVYLNYIKANKLYIKMSRRRVHEEEDGYGKSTSSFIAFRYLAKINMPFQIELVENVEEFQKTKKSKIV